MKQKLLYFILIVFSTTISKAQFTTPNTGITWDLSDLITNAPTAITFSGGIYTLSQNLTIAPNDNLLIDSDATLHINADVQITVLGNFTCDSNAITITATNPATPYNSIIFESGSSGFLRNTTINYGKGIRVATGNFEMQSCTMSYHLNGSTASSALTFSQGSPIINNSTFSYNWYSAVGSSANVQASPQITNNYFEKNNQSNGNRPQINMGPSGVETLRITGNTIIGDITKPMTGGIASGNFSPALQNHVIIDNNIIKDNRYGMTVLGYNSTGFIRGNIIEDNHTNSDAISSGSGISLNGAGNATSISVSNNQFRRNLWGITVLGTAQVNLGDGNSNPGGNVFLDNGNGGQVYALYNNTALPIMAMNNCWIEGTPLTATNVENVISHQVDDTTLGLVTFTPFGCNPLSSTDFSFRKPVVYPNPSNGILTISIKENSNASILSINGMLMGKYNLNEGINTMNLNLASGVYILKTENSEGNFSQKLVIQ